MAQNATEIVRLPRYIDGSDGEPDDHVADLVLALIPELPRPYALLHAHPHGEELYTYRVMASFTRDELSRVLDAAGKHLSTTDDSV